MFPGDRLLSPERVLCHISEARLHLHLQPGILVILVHVPEYKYISADLLQTAVLPKCREMLFINIDRILPQSAEGISVGSPLCYLFQQVFGTVHRNIYRAHGIFYEFKALCHCFKREPIALSVQCFHNALLIQILLPEQAAEIAEKKSYCLR